MQTIIMLLVGVLLCPYSKTNSNQNIDLTGIWNISGSTSYGYLNHNIEIQDYDSSISFEEIDSWGNSKPRKVKSFLKRGNRIIIKISGNDGMGNYTSTYNLQVVNEDFLKGSYTMSLGRWGNLPGMNIQGKVTFSRQ